MLTAEGRLLRAVHFQLSVLRGLARRVGLTRLMRLHGSGSVLVDSIGLRRMHGAKVSWGRTR